MRKITILILIVSLVLSFGCKTKRVIKNESKEIIKEHSTLSNKHVEKEDIKTSLTKELSEVKKEDVKEERKEVEISGKVDKENPMTFYNVVDGDTIDLFKITGNADFIFKSSNLSKKSILNNNSVNNTSEVKEGEKSISNAVENVKEVVKDVQTKTVDIVKKDFTIGSYIVFVLWGLAIIAILVLIVWIRKSTWWTSIINKFK